MPTDVNRDQLRKLVDQGGQLVEVLPAKEYEAVHLAGAMNMPLSELGQSTVGSLQKDQPVITYCHDFQ